MRTARVALGARPPAVGPGLARSASAPVAGTRSSPMTSPVCTCAAGRRRRPTAHAGRPPVAGRAPPRRAGGGRHPSLARRLAGVGGMGGGARRPVPLRPRLAAGHAWPSSGTRITSYTARVVAPDHPVCAGVTDFPLTDELYCCPVFEDDVTPLLRTDASMDGHLFTSTYEHVVFGEAAAPDCRDHPPASDLVAWATVAERSPVVYVQPGTRPRRSPSTATARSSPTRWPGSPRRTPTPGRRPIRGRCRSTAAAEAGQRPRFRSPLRPTSVRTRRGRRRPVGRPPASPRPPIRSPAGRSRGTRRPPTIPGRRRPAGAVVRRIDHVPVAAAVTEREVHDLAAPSRRR